MGSFFSKPSMPDYQPYAQVSRPPLAATATTTTATTASANATGNAAAAAATQISGGQVTASQTGTAETAPDKVKTIIQKKNALPQTIQTSFRGVLAQGEWVPARKSLLGE